MALSKRASNFLQKSKRETSLLTEADIRQTFIANGAPIFEPLIGFQKAFGGYIFYAGLAPIKFSLLKGVGGYPRSSNTAIVEFEESEFASPKYFFDCATTDYQMWFHLDEQGIYYEDYEAKASCFDKVAEHLALWDEIRLRKDFELIFRDRQLQSNNIDKELKLDLLPEASDQFTLWFSNEHIYMQQWQGLTTLIVSKKYSEKNNLTEL
jgi:hypothetical protein